MTSNSGSDSKGNAKTPSSATINQAKVNATQPPEWDRDKVGAEQGRWLAIGLSALIALGFLIYRFSRPKRPEEAEDPTTFTDALQEHSEEILAKCRTPREVRRFLNYLRLVATPTDDRSDESIQGLREKYLDFDTRLVGLVTEGAIHTDDSAIDAIESFYVTQCQLFGLDPRNFQPLD